MEYKYLMIGGLAFSEESDMRRLSEYAAKGWLLDSIKAGFFYKLKKGEPQNIIYSMDNQINPGEEYFEIFKEAGWTPVLLMGNQMHIFSAKEGTKPIYSDTQSETDKYLTMEKTTRKGTIISLIAAVVIIAFMALSLMLFKPAFLVLAGLLIIDLIVLVFNFMPYVAYKARIKEMKKNGSFNGKNFNEKCIAVILAVASLIYVVEGIALLLKGRKGGIFILAAAIVFLIIAVKDYRKCSRKS